MTSSSELDRSLCEWLASRTGLDLQRGGILGALERFIERRRTELGCTSEQYRRLVSCSGSEELGRLVDTSTVAYTWFFRDHEQLEAIGHIMSRHRSERPLQVWIPGCATGEDAYSIALMARRTGTNVAITATDLNAEALSHAEGGCYRQWSLRELPSSYVDAFTERPDGTFQVADDLKQRIRFAKHNLMDAAPRPPEGDGWDVVLCRNVLIYFERLAALGVFERLQSALSKRGYLILGASEVLLELPSGLRPVYLASRLTLQKVSERAPPPEESPSVRHLRVNEPCATVSFLPPRVEEIAHDPGTTPIPREDELEQMLQRGHERLDCGDIPHAEEIYRAAISRAPASAEARMYHGIALFLGGEMDQATRELRAASFLDAALWPAALYLALGYESMGLVQDAAREYRHVVRLSEASTERDREHRWLSPWHKDLLELAKRRVSERE